jgi:hypothetical protein
LTNKFLLKTYAKRYKLPSPKLSALFTVQRAYEIVAMAGTHQSVHDFERFIYKSTTLHGVVINNQLYIHPKLLYKYIGARMQRKIKKMTSF